MSHDPSGDTYGVTGSGEDELARLFPGDSEMAARMRALDWAATPVGSPESWPQNLRTAVGICLTSRFPTQILWGADLTLFYNDASIPLLGSTKHTGALGRPGRAVLEELGHQLGPMIEQVMALGEESWARDVLVFLDPVIPNEEAYVSFSFSPVLGESGRPDGVFSICSDTTERIVGARRLETLRQFARGSEANSEKETGRFTSGPIDTNPSDLPFARIVDVLASARSRMELALDRAQNLVTTRTEERDVLRRRLLEAEEAERRSLARELHDQFGQHLTALALGLAETRLMLADPQAADARLVRLEALAQLLTRDARRLALDLRPPELDDVGFTSALTTYVEHWIERVGVRADVAVNDPGVDRAVSGEIASALYRITQEALTNTAKHAHASHASVVVERTDGEVRLVVEDDGCGFDSELVHGRSSGDRRLGFAGMRERAALLGGEFHVESSIGGGTAVYVRVPTATP